MPITANSLREEGLRAPSDLVTVLNILKWADMTLEEKKAVLEEWGERCGAIIADWMRGKAALVATVEDL